MAQASELAAQRAALSSGNTLLSERQLAQERLIEVMLLPGSRTDGSDRSASHIGAYEFRSFGAACRDSCTVPLPVQHRIA